MHHSIQRALAEFYGITLFVHAAGLDPKLLELHVLWREPLQKIADQARQNAPDQNILSSGQNTPAVTPELTRTNVAQFRSLFGNIAGGKMHTYEDLDQTPESPHDNSTNVTNLALWPHVGVSASSEENLFVAENAIDGHLQSRWAAKAKDPQWITVDLGCPQAEVRAIYIAYTYTYKVSLH